MYLCILVLIPVQIPLGFTNYEVISYLFSGHSVLFFLRNGRYRGTRGGLRDFNFVSREVFLLE